MITEMELEQAKLVAADLKAAPRERAMAVGILMAQMVVDLTRFPDDETTRAQTHALAKLMLTWMGIVQEVL